MSHSHAFRFSQRAVSIITVLAVALPLQLLILVPFASADTLFSDSFGTGSTDGTFNEAPSWTEGGNFGDDAEKRAAGSGNDSASPNGGRFAVMFGDDGYICTTVDATDYENIVLSYYWRGDSDASNSSDDGKVEWKAGTGPCSESGWGNLNTLDLRDDSSWSSEADALPASVDESVFRIRFRVDSNASDEHLRVDGVSVTGDEIEELGSVTVCKVILDSDGNIVDGSGLGGPEFEVGNGDIETTFEAPLSLNTNLFGGEGNDAECVTYSELELANYTYDEEVISGGNVLWNTPLYNDDYSAEGFDLENFETYGTSDDSNGAMDLTIEERGPDRTLVVLNQYEEPYCGDSLVNQESEQCDGGEGCIMEPEEVACTLASGITATKYDDENGNGVWDEDEGPIENWEMCLWQEVVVEEEEETQIDPPYQTFSVIFEEEEEEEIPTEIVSMQLVSCQPTDVNGQTFWDSLAGGNYEVREGSQSGWHNTSVDVIDTEIVALSLTGGGVAPITLNPGSVVEAIFGNRFTPTLTGGGGGGGAPTPTVTVTKTADPAEVSPGGTVTYTISVTNNGTADAANVVVTDTQEDGLEATPEGAVRTWTLGYIAAGETKTVTYTIDVSLAALAGTYTNTAVVGGTNFLQTSAGADVTVAGGQVLGEEAAPQLSLTTTIDPPQTNPGGTFTLNLEVSNTGDADAENVIVTINLPDGFSENGPVALGSFNVFAALIPYANAAGGVLTWNAGTIPAGGSWTQSVVLNVGSGVAAGGYPVVTTVNADNASQVSADGVLTVVAGQVLGFTELPETGGVNGAMAIFLLVALAVIGLYSVGVRTALRKRE